MLPRTNSTPIDTLTGASFGIIPAATCMRICAIKWPWYKVMGLKIPHTANMVGGVYLWKDGREVPDTMNVTLEHSEEILFSWDSAFGNNQLGSSEDVLGTDGAISKN